MGVYVSGTGSLFTNNGLLNVSPPFWSSVIGSNSSAQGMTILGGAKAINNHIMNIGTSEGNKGRAVLGFVYGALVSTNASFINKASG
ncbi:Uncharacterised protein [Budvicia aquatica]|uniref:Uncharacterized protein n=2 Tax=Budvicia aquatica TaxID=82979 RepID=A0A484ZU60_9GAMM|nr:Uncharacterised protein [Budvicia aquatica]